MAVICQTLVEYGVLQSIASGFAAARYRVETIIGAGNSKYLLVAVLTMIVLLLLKRSRVR
jgi:hypothetical protein